jgi:hypothetical protein
MPLDADEIAQARAELEALPNWNARVTRIQTARGDVRIAEKSLRTQARKLKSFIAAVPLIEADEGHAKRHFQEDGGPGAWADFKAEAAALAEPGAG